jgi:hypothetical protein
MITPNLLDVPKDSPTRRERMAAFKAAHGIKTHDAGVDDHDRWIAVMFDEAWKRYAVYCGGDKTVFGLMAGACRLVEEAELCAHGATEFAAIRELCLLNGITITL